MIEFNATFIVSMISFVVFIFIMNMIFYKPILTIIRKRENYIKDNYDIANDYFQKTQLCREKIEAAIEKEVSAGKIEVNELIQKVKKNSIDRVNTNKIAADKKIQEGKQELFEAASGIKKQIDEVHVDFLSEKLYQKLLKG